MAAAKSSVRPGRKPAVALSPRVRDAWEGRFMTPAEGEGAGIRLCCSAIPPPGEQLPPLRRDNALCHTSHMEKVNLEEKFSLFHDHWKPRIVGELNGQHVKLVKFAGPFEWHHHDDGDELFLVIKGDFNMEFRDHRVRLEKGEFLIVPRGVEHCPIADQEVHVLLFEPAGTLNTGNLQTERTATVLERL